MKGILFDIKRFAVHDGPGIRTTVFFKGCPLSCRWCHNPESIDLQSFTSQKRVWVDGECFEHAEEVGTACGIDEIMNILLRDRVFYDESGGGVTFSGGEPLQQPEFLAAVLEACRREGLHTAIDTSGHVHQRYLDMIMPDTNLFLYDLKHVDPVKHKEFTGSSNELVLSNLRYLAGKNKPVRIRIPVIPSFNHNENNMIEIMLFLQSLTGKVEQVDLLPYHTLGKNKYKRFALPDNMKGIPALKKDDIIPYVKLFKEGGFKVTIGG